GLDLARQFDAPPVDLGTAGCLDRGDDVGDGHRAEEPTAAARLDRHRDGQGLELGPDLPGVAEVAPLADVARPLERRDLLLGAPGPAHREPARDEVAAAVPVLDLDRVAGRAQTGHLLREDELHVASAQRAVLVYGSSAISRAFFTARAMCPICCAVTTAARRRATLH